MEEAYLPEYEKMSTYPAHLMSKQGQLLPSALIPYCSFSTKMLDLGERVENFTYPLCTAFTPTLHNGQVCYELDTDKIKNAITPANNGGLVLLLDMGKERSVTVRKKYTEDQHERRSDDKLVLGKDLSLGQVDTGQLYIHTLQPYTFQLHHDTNFVLTSLKAMTGTNNFLALSNGKKGCSVEPFEQCKVTQLRKISDSKCECVHYGHGVIRGNRKYKVRRRKEDGFK